MLYKVIKLILRQSEQNIVSGDFKNLHFFIEDRHFDIKTNSIIISVATAWRENVKAAFFQNCWAIFSLQSPRYICFEERILLTALDVS